LKKDASSSCIHQIQAQKGKIVIYEQERRKRLKLCFIRYQA
jgi:hypothetical protein